MKRFVCFLIVMMLMFCGVSAYATSSPSLSPTMAMLMPSLAGEAPYVEVVADIDWSDYECRYLEFAAEAIYIKWTYKPDWDGVVKFDVPILDTESDWRVMLVDHNIIIGVVTTRYVENYWETTFEYILPGYTEGVLIFF